MGRKRGGSTMTTTAFESLAAVDDCDDLQAFQRVYLCIENVTIDTLE